MRTSSPRVSLVQGGTAPATPLPYPFSLKWLADLHYAHVLHACSHVTVALPLPQPKLRQGKLRPCPCSHQRPRSYHLCVPRDPVNPRGRRSASFNSPPLRRAANPYFLLVAEGTVSATGRYADSPRSLILSPSSPPSHLFRLITTVSISGTRCPKTFCWSPTHPPPILRLHLCSTAHDVISLSEYRTSHKQRSVAPK